MSEEIQRLLGGLLARVESLEKKVARNESAWIVIGAGAVAIVFAIIAKQAGLI